MTIRDSLAQVKGSIEALASAKDKLMAFSDERKAVWQVIVFLRTHGPELMKMLDRHGAGDAEDGARLRHLLDRHLSLTPVEGGGWDIAEYSEHGIETVLFGHTDARAAIDRVMQYHGQTDEAARAGERG